MECPKSKTKVITPANHEDKTMNQSKLNSKQLHVADAKRGKTLANVSWFVLLLLLIRWKTGASFLSQSSGKTNYFSTLNWKPL